MNFTVFDAEADALYDEVTKIHCVCASVYTEDGTLLQKVSFTSYEEMEAFIQKQDCIIGHNIIRYDIPVFKKILGFAIASNIWIIDTLALSWYLYPTREKHGLEWWGYDVGVRKPVVTDWVNANVNEYIFRCNSDVEINSRIFFRFIKMIKLIYDVDTVEQLPIINYLMFKMDCAREQEEYPLKIDREHCMFYLKEVEIKIEEKLQALREVMPKTKVYTTRKKPSAMFKKDGSLSKAGINWLEVLFDNDLPPEFDGEIKIIKQSIEAKPNSPSQLKNWLYSLGWEPTIFNYVVDKKTEKVRAVPQLQDKDKNLCPNIILLAEKYPALEHLKGLFMLQHRQGVFRGFLEKADENGFMKAEVDGLTNTLRFKHRKPIANLPSVDKPYGKEIRGAIIAPDEDSLFCGSDMSSLEDSTKQHFMYFYDPRYVMQMRVPGFDPHIDIAVLAGLLSKEDEEFFKWADKQEHLTQEEFAKYAIIKVMRKKGKVVNFSGIYGAGPPKISQASGMSLAESITLHKIYWERNKAVKQISADVTIKVIFKSGSVKCYLGRELMAIPRDYQKAFFDTVGSMWLYNPVSTFWYSLRKPKDSFSTLNQGTGVYCFDVWISEVRERGIKIGLQYHDEIGFAFKKVQMSEVKKALTDAIEETNNKLRLNVPLGISIDIGVNYAEAH